MRLPSRLTMRLALAAWLLAAAGCTSSVPTLDSTYGKAGVSLERVRSLIDPSVVDTADLSGLAEMFRLQIRMWGEATPEPVLEEIEPVLKEIEPVPTETEPVLTEMEPVPAPE